MQAIRNSIINASLRCSSSNTILNRSTALLSIRSFSAAANIVDPVGVASGAPEEFVTRKVRILRPAKSVMQSSSGSDQWRIEFDTSSNKWINPLMGWTSSNDTAGQLANLLVFDSKDEAVNFAEKEGFQYEIVPDHEKKLKKKSYSENFKWKGHSASTAANTANTANTAAQTNQPK